MIIIIIIIIVIFVIKRTHPRVKNDAPINQVKRLKYFYESNLLIFLRSDKNILIYLISLFLFIAKIMKERKSPAKLVADNDKINQSSNTNNIFFIYLFLIIRYYVLYPFHILLHNKLFIN